MDAEVAGVLCAATAAAFLEGASVDTVLAAAVAAAPDFGIWHFEYEEPVNLKSHLSRMLGMLEGVSDFKGLRDVLYGNFLEYNGQDPLEVVTFTLGIFKVSGGDALKAMQYGTNLGRDSDTTSCQASLLCSILGGIKSIPPEVMEVIPENRIKIYERTALGYVGLVKEKIRRCRDYALLPN
jgi:hypothetical protein